MTDQKCTGLEINWTLRTPFGASSVCPGTRHSALTKLSRSISKRFGRKHCAMLYLIECLQRFLGESAEKIVGAQLATQTAFNAGQTIRRFHGCSSFTERLGSVACPISTDLFSGRILGSHLYGH